MDWEYFLELSEVGLRNFSHDPLWSGPSPHWAIILLCQCDGINNNPKSHARRKPIFARGTPEYVWDRILFAHLHIQLNTTAIQLHSHAFVCAVSVTRHTLSTVCVCRRFHYAMYTVMHGTKKSKGAAGLYK